MIHCTDEDRMFGAELNLVFSLVNLDGGYSSTIERIHLLTLWVR